MHRRICILVVLGTQAFATTHAQEVLFRDDFDEEAILAPLRPSDNTGTRTLDGGKWVLQPVSSGLMSGYVPDLGTSDHSVRAQVSTLDDPEGDWVFMGIYGRNEPGGLYWGGVGSNGDLFIGYIDGFTTINSQQAFGLDTALGVNLRLDIIEDEINFWGWQVGDPEPVDPQLTMTDSRFTFGDGAGLTYNPRGSTNHPRVAFEFLEVTTVPEPGGYLLALAGSGVLLGLRRPARRQTIHGSDRSQTRQLNELNAERTMKSAMASLVTASSLILAMTFAAGVSAQQTVISPSEFATTEMPNAASLANFPSYRLQQVYDAADFAGIGPGPYTITRIDWRPGSEMTETIDYPADRFLMTFSTTQVDPSVSGDVFDREFAKNVGANVQTVFDGPVTLTTANAGPVEGPKAFDYGFDLHTPYVYDPAAGNLLMDLTVINGQTALLLDFVDAETATTRLHWTGTLGVDSPLSALLEDVGGQRGGHALQFTIVPEPTAVAIVTVGLLCLAAFRRRQRWSLIGYE